ncbi:peptidoglycan-binding domain 1 protein [Synechococcus virus S-ESS1]|uniref:Peptidoglycan-binding domain 1 protein n=1 Tax=Synechococcus virus S-ESS1 TaxID=1964565 RepID=A0A1V0DX43_9CAUD|nr:endolysin [Synechococcus virus S-ESS1]ARB05723.1 peptidoglycan-binding domain 1 protein [Synechococcus virus S-ESS1]
MITNFSGAAKPLDKFDIPELAYRIDVSEDHLQAFLNVESRSQGFDRAGRPIILCEPHVFYRNLTGKERDAAVAAGLAYKNWGEKPYPSSQDLRYQWLMKAQKINAEAALKACSWGSTQVLGENFSMVGYPTAEAMVRAFMDDEENHVEAMVRYILATGIADDMKAERWDTVARVYNGPGYKKNGYHTKMASEFRKLRGVPDSGWKSDTEGAEMLTLTTEEMKTLQRRLGELGYSEVGWADGKWGTKTRAAQLAFRADNGLPLVAGITADLMAALMLAKPREVSKERLETGAQDLRKAGSRTVAKADKTTAGAGLVLVGGALEPVSEVLDGLSGQVEALRGLTGTLEGLLGSMEGMSPYLLVGLGLYMIWQQWGIKQARVEDHHTGKNPYPGGS